MSLDLAKIRASMLWTGNLTGLHSLGWGSQQLQPLLFEWLMIPKYLWLVGPEFSDFPHPEFFCWFSSPFFCWLIPYDTLMPRLSSLIRLIWATEAESPVFHAPKSHGVLDPMLGLSENNVSQDTVVYHQCHQLNPFILGHTLFSDKPITVNMTNNSVCPLLRHVRYR